MEPTPVWYTVPYARTLSLFWTVNLHRAWSTATWMAPVSPAARSSSPLPRSPPVRLKASISTVVARSLTLLTTQDMVEWPGLRRRSGVDNSVASPPPLSPSTHVVAKTRFLPSRMTDRNLSMLLLLLRSRGELPCAVGQLFRVARGRI